MHGTYPIDLVLVRHGQSEGNLAQECSMKGDDSLWTQEFYQRHTSRYRLTDKGIAQAKSAGEWIRQNITTKFDRYYCSEYIRAMETASLLSLPKAKWFCEFYLREQDQGVFAGKSKTERKRLYAEELRRRKLDSFYWAPPGGESIANCCLRVDRFLAQLRESCSGFRVITVCHGNILKAMRIRIERMKQVDWANMRSKPHQRTYNCQILHYTRRDPVTGVIHPHLKWFRSVCPWDMSRSSNKWQAIQRPVWTNEGLMDVVRTVPRVINNEPNDRVVNVDDPITKVGQDTPTKEERPKKEPTEATKKPIEKPTEKPT
mmetsp:Transcript_15386/g.17127  ORF Transcript_15386/g.17127 Transcript_15386/m.17127 type:complete len:316 (-) Transcript_15386:24-971(-)